MLHTVNHSPFRSCSLSTSLRYLLPGDVLLLIEDGGTSHQWLHYLRGYLLFAAIATPLVFSVHSIVSWDFATANVPGWHSTIFAPYFVMGAIFSGCAMILTIIIPMRLIFPQFAKIMKIGDLESLGKMILFTSLIVTYAYCIEFFSAYYSSSKYESAIFWYRAFGEMKPVFWIMIFCNSLVPLLLWFKKVRCNIPILFIISILINLGMWLERFTIITSSLAHDYNPFTWGSYRFEWVEIWITIGSFSLFFFLFFIFVKVMPSLAVAELKGMMTPPLRRAK